MVAKRKAKNPAPTKESRLIEQAVRAAGGHVEYTANGHLRVHGPSGGITTVGSKLVDRRTWLNSLARLRAIGIDLRSRPGRTPEAAS
jgi:hypothetical protein